MRRSVAVLVLVPWCTIAFCQTVAGAGNSSCGDVVQAHVDQPITKAVALGYMGWVQGYLSATNFDLRFKLHGAEFAIPSPAAIGVYIDKYCRDNPLDSLQQSAAALAEDLQKRSLRDAPAR